MYASAQFLDFLDLAKNCSFLHWKYNLCPIYIWMDTNSGFRINQNENRSTSPGRRSPLTSCVVPSKAKTYFTCQQYVDIDNNVSIPYCADITDIKFISFEKINADVRYELHELYRLRFYVMPDLIRHPKFISN